MRTTRVLVILSLTTTPSRVFLSGICLLVIPSRGHGHPGFATPVPRHDLTLACSFAPRPPLPPAGHPGFATPVPRHDLTLACSFAPRPPLPPAGHPGFATPVPRHDLTLACSFAPRAALPPGIGYALRPMLSSRSRRTVFALARSRRARPTRAGLFATPMARWSLRLNSSSVRSLTFCSSSSLCISRHLIAFMLASEGPRPAHEPGLDADLLGGQPEPVTGGGLVHALHLVEDAAGLDHGHPELGIPLALAHPGLGGLLGHRLVGKDPDEDLAASLDTARERHPRRFDLPVGHPPGFERLEAVVAEGQGRAALGRG